MLAGRWTYRAFRNDWQLVGDNAAAALALISSEGVLDFDEAQDGRFRGALGMAPGYALVLIGEIDVASGAPPRFTIHGSGIEGTPTEGWRYEYRGVVGYSWPGRRTKCRRSSAQPCAWGHTGRQARAGRRPLLLQFAGAKATAPGAFAAHHSLRACETRGGSAQNLAFH